MTNFKYTASIHTNPDQVNVKFIGKVSANSIKDLKEKARKQARSWNEHLSGRLHLQDEETGMEWMVNP